MQDCSVSAASCGVLSTDRGGQMFDKVALAWRDGLGILSVTDTGQKWPVGCPLYNGKSGQNCPLLRIMRSQTKKAVHRKIPHSSPRKTIACIRGALKLDHLI